MWAWKQYFFVLAAFGATAFASQEQPDPQIPHVHPVSNLTSLQGYPGVLSRDAVQAAVNAEMRNKIITWANEGNSSVPVQKNHRDLGNSGKSGDFSTFNSILSTFVINIPPQNLVQDVLGTTATVGVSGFCTGFTVDFIGLEYKKSGNALTYKLVVLGIDLVCKLEVYWDLGVLDIGDDLKIKISLKGNNVRISVTLQGSPPDTATFNGCEIYTNVDSITSSGGFSSDILNELSDLIIAIADNEREVISDLLCELIADFQDTVDGLLMTLSTNLEPYLTAVANVDPLELEKNLVVSEPLVNFLDSNIGDVIQVFIDNLQGVIGAYQINTFIELNLVDKNGVLTVDLSNRRSLQQDAATESCSPFRFRHRNLKNNGQYDFLMRKLATTIEQELSGLIEPIFPEALERHLQQPPPPNVEVIDTENLFTFNEIIFLTLEIVGLNTFKDTDYLQIIGQYTFRSQLALTGLAFRLTFILDIDINQVNVKPTIVVTIPVDWITVTASYLVGLSEEVVDSFTLGTFTNTSNILPCILSALVVAGVSELDVQVGEIQTVQVEGVLDTGIDDVLNTAIEGVFCTYQDLILRAVPNIFQNNVTVILNDFLECYIRTEGANAVCAKAQSDSLLESLGLGGGDGATGDSGGGEESFSAGESSSVSFGEKAEAVTTYIYGTTKNFTYIGNTGTGNETPVTSTSDSDTGDGDGDGDGFFVFKSGSFISGDQSSFQGAAASSDGLIKGFIDFRDLLLPPEEAKNLGGSGEQQYGDLISMAFGILKDQMASIDNTTGLPTINTNLLEPLTVGQSGSNGTLRFPEQLFNMSLDTSENNFLRSLLQRIDFSAFDARIGNLNTIVNPVKFMEPTSSAHVLENIFHFGPYPDRPLNMTVGLSFALDGTNSPLALSNEIDMHAMASELDIFTKFRLLVATDKFLQFPLADILNFNCWLALIQAPNIDLKGIESINNALAIETFVMKVVSMGLDLKCFNCSSTSLPGVIRVLEEVGATKTLGNRLGLLLEEILTSDTAPFFLTKFLKIGEEAARLCPHSPTFNTTPEEAAISLEIPPLSSRSIDTVLFSSILGAEILSVVLAESHLSNPVEPSDPLPGQVTVKTDAETNLLDWTKLNETFIPFADDVLQMARDFLGGSSDGSGNLGVTDILSDFLDDGGGYFLELSDAAFEVNGLVVSVQTVHIAGLDSFTRFDVLKPIAPQTLQNSIELDTLSLKIEFSINVTTTPDPPQVYSVSLDLDTVNATVSVYTLIDMDEVASLEIGSLMFIENMMPCLLSTASDVHIPSMQVAIGKVSNLVIEGLLADTSDVTAASIKAIFENFGTEMKESISKVFDGTIRTFLNTFLSSLVNEATGCSNETRTLDYSSEGIDFRDFLLPPEDARTLGGSGNQPYGDLFPMLFGLLQKELLKSTDEGILEANAMLIEPLTESQTGVKGLLRFKDELFNLAMKILPNGPLTWLEELLTIRAFDARIDNINTLVGPLSILQPSHQAHILENMINFGPVSGRPLNATIGLSVGLNGSLPFMDMFNAFNITVSLDEIDLFTDLGFQIAKDRLFHFPLKSVLEMNCWLSLVEASHYDGSDGNKRAIEIKTFLLQLVSLSLKLRCSDCSTSLLPKLVDVIDQAGVSRVLGNRLGPLMNEIASSPLFSTALAKFINLGDDAARMCPHSPLYSAANTDDVVTEGDSVMKEGDLIVLPQISAMTLDTLLFTLAVATDVAAVLVAESHLHNAEQLGDMNLDNNWLVDVPEGSSVLDWTNLNNTQVPFIGKLLNLIQDSLGSLSDSGDGTQDLAINILMGAVLREDGIFAFPLTDVGFEASGVFITLNQIRLQGLTSFTDFSVLSPSGPQTVGIEFAMKKLLIGLDLAIDVLETQDPPKHVNISMGLQDINFSMPLYIALDEDRLASIELGSLLHSSNILRCFLSTAYGLRVQQMLVSVGNIVAPAIEGLLPDTSDAYASMINTIIENFGDTITESLPIIFDGTIKSLLNGFLENLEKTECQQFPTDNLSRYMDFRELLSSDVSAKNPYGDLLPIIKQLVEAELLSPNTETGMPKVNDILIAPITQGQSSIVGTLAIPGKLFEFGLGGMKQIGIDQVQFEISDARIEHMDTIGLPLKILEPNKTSGVLLDNRATFGTELEPLRFAINLSLMINGSIVNVDDKMEIFGELRQAPFFAVLLARIGSEEFLTYPFRFIADLDCWLAMIATPALEEIGRGASEVDPVLALPYVEIIFSSLRVGSSCSNCTTPGLNRLPDLFDILDESGAKDVLGRRTLELAMDLLESDFIQVWVLRFLQDSMRKCERTESFLENSIVITSPELPPWSLEWLETGAFAVSVFSQVGAVILADMVSVLGAELAPILSYPEYEVSPQTRLVDFTDLDKYPLGGLVKYFIEGTNSFLGGESTDPETGETTLGINEILADNPVYPLDEFSMELDNINFAIDSFQIALKSVKISGIDTFTKFQILNITGPTRFQNELAWENLHLELRLELGVRDTAEKLSFVLLLEIADIETSVEVMLGLDYELMKNLELGSILRMAHILPCVQATVEHLEVTDAILNIGRINKMSLLGFASKDTSTASELFERMLLEKYGTVLAGAAPSLFSVVLKPLLNTAITSYLRKSDFKCDEFPFDDDSAGFIDFRDMFLSPTQSKKFGGSGQAQYGDLLRTAYGILQLQLMTAHPENGIEMLSPIVGDVSIPGVLLNQGIKFQMQGMKADITLRVSDLRIQNLDSIGRPLSLLAPVKNEAHQLNNSGTFGIGSRPVILGLRMYMHIKGLGDKDIVNDISLSLDIHRATVVLTALLKVSEMAFVRFPLRDMLNLNCWLATIPPPALDSHGFRVQGSESTAGLTNLGVLISQLNLNLVCHNCSSPALIEMEELVSAPGSSEDMTKLANEVIDSIASKLGGDFLQDRINRLLVEAPRRCGHASNYEPDAPPIVYEMFKPVSTNSSSYIPILVFAMVPVVLSVVIALAVRHIVHQRHKKWLVALPSEKIFLIQQKQENADQLEAGINELSTSMYRSQVIPCALRQIIPIVIVVNIAFFLSGHLNLGGRVLVQFVVAGQTFKLDEIATFSIGQSTIDLWNSGAKELALLILLFSGVWPYTKQLITFALWFLPPSVVSCTRRGQFLLWLDILAKWSMIDIIVMLITVAGFRVQIDSPQLAFVPDDLYGADLLVVPMWGLYANLIAQLLTQLSSHVIVYYHRRILKAAREAYDQRQRLEPESGVVPPNKKEAVGVVPPSTEEEADQQEKEQLCHHPFTRPHRNASDRLVVRRFVNILLPLASVVLCVLLAVSSGVPSLKLETLGVVGLVVELGQKLEPAVRYEGIFSTAKLLVDEARFLGGFVNYVGLGFLALLFVATVLIVPILQVMILVYQWLAPLTPRRREDMAVILEILQAWQYVEVYIMAIIIQSWQLGSISKFLLNRFCTSLDFTLSLLVYYGVLKEADAQCFALEASITTGAYLLVLFTVALAILNTFVVKAYIQQLRDKQEELDDVSEDDKLRAFDRTTWDNHSDALASIRSPDVLFTDFFRGVLKRQATGAPGQSFRTMLFSDPAKLLEIETFSLLGTRTCRSDEEHGGEVTSTADSDRSLVSSTNATH